VTSWRSLVLAACATACGSPGEVPQYPNLDLDHALPRCGEDPSVQPDKCVDTWGGVRCKVDSGYTGDELALCEPDPEEGMLIHFGPRDYSADSVAPFLLPAGEEGEF
jgi:hypothetical protein